MRTARTEATIRRATHPPEAQRRALKRAAPLHRMAETLPVSARPHRPGAVQTEIITLGATHPPEAQRRALERAAPQHRMAGTLPVSALSHRPGIAKTEIIIRRATGQAMPLQ
ncbi:MAG: hypothetical protein IPH16_19350 [Haliscomenobacter sp.]|nr:hypothetical protein [Haliscomenobacter sp.]